MAWQTDEPITDCLHISMFHTLHVTNFYHFHKHVIFIFLYITQAFFIMDYCQQSKHMLNIINVHKKGRKH
jgi:hypothetical protein